MSSIALKAENHEWYLDARWIAFRKRPSRRMLLNRARKIGATHYVLDQGPVWLVGFYTFDENVRMKALTPAALSVAKYLGANIYAVIEPVPGKFWVVATDSQGVLKPFADTVLSADDLERFEARFDPEILERRVTIDLSGIDPLLSRLEPQSLKLVAIKTPRTLILLGLLTGLLACAGGCAWLWHQHERNLLAADLAEQRRKQILDEHMKEARLTVVTPDDWITACMQAEKNSPLYHAGWLAQEWACENDTFRVVWIRAGGTLADAPQGQADGKGDRIVSTVGIEPRRVHPVHVSTRGAARLLQAKLQASGVEADLHPDTTRPGSVGPAASSIQFDWPTDPRTTSWNAIPGLQIISLRGSTGISGTGGNTPVNPGIYKITARLQTGVTP